MGQRTRKGGVSILPVRLSSRYGNERGGSKWMLDAVFEGKSVVRGREGRNAARRTRPRATPPPDTPRFGPENRADTPPFVFAPLPWDQLGPKRTVCLERRNKQARLVRALERQSTCGRKKRKTWPFWDGSRIVTPSVASSRNVTERVLARVDVDARFQSGRIRSIFVSFFAWIADVAPTSELHR
eukprot:scaffold47_cov334-Pavlova_lutheri.AAC.24